MFWFYEWKGEMPKNRTFLLACKQLVYIYVYSDDMCIYMGMEAQNYYFGHKNICLCSS